jgi:hypothetical protein
MLQHGEEPARYLFGRRSVPANGQQGRQLCDLRRRLHRSKWQGSCLPAILSECVSPSVGRIIASPAVALQRGGFVTGTELIGRRTIIDQVELYSLTPCWSGSDSSWCCNNQKPRAVVIVATPSLSISRP